MQLCAPGCLIPAIEAVGLCVASLAFLLPNSPVGSWQAGGGAHDAGRFLVLAEASAERRHKRGMEWNGRNTWIRLLDLWLAGAIPSTLQAWDCRQTKSKREKSVG